MYSVCYRNTTYSEAISAISIILMASKMAAVDQGPLKELVKTAKKYPYEDIDYWPPNRGSCFVIS